MTVDRDGVPSGRIQSVPPNQHGDAQSTFGVHRPSSGAGGGMSPLTSLFREAFLHPRPPMIRRG